MSPMLILNIFSPVVYLEYFEPKNMMGKTVFIFFSSFLFDEIEWFTYFQVFIFVGAIAQV